MKINLKMIQVPFKKWQTVAYCLFTLDDKERGKNKVLLFFSETLTKMLPLRLPNT